MAKEETIYKNLTDGITYMVPGEEIKKAIRQKINDQLQPTVGKSLTLAERKIASVEDSVSIMVAIAANDDNELSEDALIIKELIYTARQCMDEITELSLSLRLFIAGAVYELTPEQARRFGL